LTASNEFTVGFDGGVVDTGLTRKRLAPGSDSSDPRRAGIAGRRANRRFNQLQKDCYRRSEFRFEGRERPGGRGDRGCDPRPAHPKRIATSCSKSW